MAAVTDRATVQRSIAVSPWGRTATETGAPSPTPYHDSRISALSANNQAVSAWPGCTSYRTERRTAAEVRSTMTVTTMRAKIVARMPS